MIFKINAVRGKEVGKIYPSYTVEKLDLKSKKAALDDKAVGDVTYCLFLASQVEIPKTSLAGQ